MPLVNSIEPYVPGAIPFSQYLEQLNWVLLHQKIPADEHKATFLASCGTEVYSELKLLFPGKDLANIELKELTDSLKKRYDRSESDLVQRVKFYARSQKPGERAVDFVLSVKQLAEYCNFGNFKDMAIRDRLVCGVSNKQLQERLLDEEELTLSKAEKIIVNREEAAERLTSINGEPARVSVVERLGNKRVGFQREPTPVSSRGRRRSRENYNRRNNGSRSRSRSFSTPRKNGKKVYFCIYCRRKGS